MKKIMMTASAVMLLSTSAFATKARLQALGEDKDGSYYISDYRNIYINPAELNSMGNMAIFEWGGAGASATSGISRASLDLDNNTKAQGGVLYGLSNGIKIGAILGDETDVAALTRILSSNGGATNEGLQSADNVLDVFVAGKSAVNWGANLLYTSTKNEAASARYNQHSYAARLGASQDAWNVHLLLALGAKADAPDYTKTPTYKGNFGARVGGGYDLSAENKTFGMYESYTWDQTNSTTATRKGAFSKAMLGFGHSKKVTDNSTMFIKLHGESTHIQLDSVGSLAAAKIDRLAFPISIGFEHTSTEWLVLRGSVIQNLYGTVKDSGLDTNFGTAGAGNMGAVIRSLANQKYGASTSGTGGKKTLANSTQVNAGATLTFGSLSVDGLIGATPASRAGTPASAADTNGGVLALDNLETRVGVTYKF